LLVAVVQVLPVALLYPVLLLLLKGVLEVQELLKQVKLEAVEEYTSKLE
jgi:hypothetical protein